LLRIQIGKLSKLEVSLLTFSFAIFHLKVYELRVETVPKILSLNIKKELNEQLWREENCACTDKYLLVKPQAKHSNCRSKLNVLLGESVSDHENYIIIFWGPSFILSANSWAFNVLNDVCLYCRTTVLWKTADNVYIDGTG
jgi:hypothetical protein